MDLKIVNGNVVTADVTFRAEIGIKDGRIVEIAEKIAGEAKRVIDAKNNYVLPGGIDIHTHMELPFCNTVSSDDFETGSRAAACGGVTTFMDFALGGKEDIITPVEKRRQIADPKVCIDYSLHGGIIEWRQDTPRQIRKLADMGVTSFKLFTVYRNEGWMADDGVFYQALRETTETGGLICVHAENVSVIELLTAEFVRKGQVGCKYFPLSRPVFTEAEAISRCARWAEVTGGNLYIVHMSSGQGADEVASARSRGAKVYAETAATYLMLTDEKFNGEDGPLYATCPPLRKREDCIRLWKGLVDGSVHAVATDHCAFTRKQKAMCEGNFTKIPFGMPSIETNLPIIFSEGVNGGRFSINHFVRLSSTNPAKLFGMFPQKGTIAVGSDADIVIWDASKEVTLSAKTHHMNVDYSPFEGLKVKGYPVMTISRGRIIWDGKNFTGEKGWGRFIKRGPVIHP